MSITNNGCCPKNGKGEEIEYHVLVLGLTLIVILCRAGKGSGGRLIFTRRSEYTRNGRIIRKPVGHEAYPMKAITPILWKLQGIARRTDFNRHDPWLVSSMTAFNHAGAAGQSIGRGARRFRKWIISAMLAWTAAASIGLGCLLMADNPPDAGPAPAETQATHVVSAVPPGNPIAPSTAR